MQFGVKERLSPVPRSEECRGKVWSLRVLRGVRVIHHYFLASRNNPRNAHRLCARWPCLRAISHTATPWGSILLYLPFSHFLSLSLFLTHPLLDRFFVSYLPDENKSSVFVFLSCDSPFRCAILPRRSSSCPLLWRLLKCSVQRSSAERRTLFHSGSHNEITVISCSPSHANHRSNLP